MYRKDSAFFFFTLNFDCEFFRGNVVTLECVEKIIKKDMVDPTCNKKLTDKDIIPLQRVSISHNFWVVNNMNISKF